MTSEEAAWNAYYQKCDELTDKIVDKMFSGILKEAAEMETMKPCDAIMEYFEATNRPVTRNELKELTAAERREIAELCAAELRVELK